MDLFASQESTQCPLWFSLSHPNSLEIDALAHPWPDMKLYAFPPVKLIPAVLCRVKTSGVRPSPSSPILAFPDVVLGVGLPSGGRSMGYSVQERPAMSASGHPCPEIWKLWVWPIIGHKAHLSLIITSGGPLSALTCCVNARLLSAIKKISPLIYSQSWDGSWVYTTQAMMTFTLIF